MTLVDLLLAGAIVLGAVYLIYRTLWKKQGYCPGCNGHTCSGGRNDLQPTLRRNENGQTD
jgi:hypothetical protein